MSGDEFNSFSCEPLKRLEAWLEKEKKINEEIESQVKELLRDFE